MKRYSVLAGRTRTAFSIFWTKTLIRSAVS
jgi:hypothetical protein